MTFLKILLLPFTFLYGILMDFRNHLYDIGYKRSFRFQTHLINVGNLTVGGTGKTPHIEYLIRLLKDKYPLTTLSRGYGRRTSGFILAHEGIAVKDLGDEPSQFYQKFYKEINVAVGEERALAIPCILFEVPATEVILLDDAFQHRAVVPDVNILLSDYYRPFYEDLPLPSGRLRERRRGAERADIIIVSKCPHSISEDEMQVMKSRIFKYSRPGIPVFFTGLEYGTPLPVFENTLFRFTNNIFLFSGIAQMQSLNAYLFKNFNVLGYKKFNDHHDYKPEDIQKILKEFNAFAIHNKCLITTEKDMVKLRQPHLGILLKDIPIFYLPIRVCFLNGKQQFDEIILNAAGKNNN
jgi:tetraacyldisaccharide 4'-kinase